MSTVEVVILDRERLINRYIGAMENNDVDTIAEVLALALDDSELARAIDGVNDAYTEELGID